jgi:hypothetical protein
MRRLLVLFVAMVLWAAPAQAAERVSVQPFEGDIGPALRQQITRILRGHGYRVVTSIPRVSGTGQYLTLARDHHLAAFVTGDIETRGRRPKPDSVHTVTFLVWNGSNGSVLARWSASAVPKRMPKAIAKGFWKRLGKALENASAPPLPPELGEAPPMYINASDP